MSQAHLRAHQVNDTKRLKKVRTLTDRMVQLTGTPSPNGLIDVWSQMFLLDGGDAVEAHIFDKLNNGQAFDGYKLVEGRSTRAWQDEQQAAIALADKVPSDKLFTQKLIS